MIVTTCFLQYVAVANKPPRQPGDTHTYPTSRPQNPAKWPAILIAASLHLAWIAMPSDETQTEFITLPKPIMVNWIDAPIAKTAAPATAPKTEPKPDPKRENPKPKPRPKAVKPQPVVATQRQMTSEISVPVYEPAIEKETSEATTPTKPAPAVSSASPANSQTHSQTESDQKPTSLPSLNADYLNNPPPSYPPQSRELGEQGKVLLRVLVNANGGVEQVNLRKSSGYQRLDQAAQDSVKQWRFVPAKRGDQAITAWVVVPISFSLQG